ENRSSVLKKQFIWELDSSLDDVQCNSRMMLNLRLLLRELIGHTMRQPEVLSLNFSAGCINSRVLLISLSYQLSDQTQKNPASFPVPSLLMKRIKALGA